MYPRRPGVALDMPRAAGMAAAQPIDVRPAPPHHGHIHHPPPPLAERDRLLLLIAAFKFVKAALFVVVALGTFGLLSRHVAAWAQDGIATLAATYDRGLTHRVVALLERISALSRHRLEALGVAALLYAGLFVTEGVGLWRGRRWAEYLTVVATASLIPFEVYEIARRTTAPRVGALVVNLLVVAYLVRQLRRPGER
jgi:uncharacterized membrane protein (DUF2068 family)